ncbi:MAG TPA: serine/threonine-protein kinase [Planctomycetota bacterium]|nr:serine/threonine-protein kinase [Planctomycetota bacterium]
MSDELRPGTLLDERFKITDLINKGGMASIYEAIDQKTGQVVAIKIPFMRFESDPSFFFRFEREEEVGIGLQHPSILRIIPVAPKCRPYIVMERLYGELLSDLMRRERLVPIPMAIQIILRIADALEYMHEKRVTHRDLKPANIMMCKDGSIRVMDLGLAKSDDRRQITVPRISGTMGTPHFMAPEQVKGTSAGGRTDLYSLGAILYVMVTGAMPFAGDDPFTVMHARVVGDPIAPRSINPAISPALEEIILHAMARNPEKRYASILEMKRDLQAPEAVVPTGRDKLLVAPSMWKVRWRRIRPFAWGIVIFILLMAACTVIARLIKPHRSVGQVPSIHEPSVRGGAMQVG